MLTRGAPGEEDFAPDVPATVEDPALTLPADDPVRAARKQFFAALLKAFGEDWWRMEERERAALAVQAFLEANPDQTAWERRIRYDALVRWALGIKETPESMLKWAKWRLAGLGADAKATLYSVAEKLGQVLAGSV